MHRFVMFAAFVSFVAGCGDGGGGRQPADYDPQIDPADFVAGIDNPYLPLPPGTTRHYESVTDEGTEVITYEITHETKVIMGVTCVVVHDSATLDGELIEDTFDWFAQDADGAVWYFGEDTTEYDGGQPVGTEGSWEAGVDGAKPGIVMQADPAPGEPYYQEYEFDEAEDQGQVLAVGESVTVPYGSFDDCVKTKDWTELEPDVVENKWYCRDVGEVRAEVVQGGSEVEELVDVTTE